MSSVTVRIKEIKQPRGGYIKPSEFDVTELDDGRKINEIENVHATIVGLAVDYLTRFMMGADIKSAFEISINGALIAQKLCGEKVVEEIEFYLNGIKGLDDTSITNACKAVTFDVWLRNPVGAILAKRADETNPDMETIQNIRIFVERSIAFWEKYGPIVVDGFTFGEKGYTDTVDSGDGDFLTNDTLWDFKVSKAKPKSSNTLQLLMYYIMGKHSEKEEFKKISKLGIFNPRLNTVYQLDICKVSSEIIKTVEDDVICY